MKKTIAKVMAAAMLVASLPAMAMPTFNVEAGAGSVSVAAFTFNGSYANNQTAYWDDNEDKVAYYNGDTFAVGNILKLESNNGMVQTSTANEWNTNIVLKSNWNESTHTGDAIGSQTLVAGVDKDYVDDTATVDSISTDSKGFLKIKLKSDALNTYQTNLRKGNGAKTIKFYIFDRIGSDDKKVADFEIQIGESLVANKATTIKGGVQTPDTFIQDATVVIESNGSATLKSISDTDKKVNMKDQDIEISEVLVAGVTFEVKKFDDKALKKGTMKTIKAANIKNLGTGALRNCKKLRKVRMGSAKMRKIHSNAFYDCGKLKNIKINCKNLKSVGSKAFKKLKKNCQISIKAGKSKYNQVVKMIKKSGTDQVKFKRV
jgi:hypothetical protein